MELGQHETICKNIYNEAPMHIVTNATQHNALEQ